MGRTRNLVSRWKVVALIWITAATLFFSIFNLALKNSPRNISLKSSDSDNINRERRARLYDKMARDIDEKGPAFIKHGETSQSLSLSDVFTFKDGVVAPVLKAANPPVRANVLYLSTQFSIPISETVSNVFRPYFTKAIWFQNSSMYHFSMFHASHHIKPVPASETEIEAEAAAVKAVAEGFCPLKIVLDRVILTSTGVLLGCWQVKSGTDPMIIRAKLRGALPLAPEKQLYDAAILHTTFARLLGQPSVTSKAMQNIADQLIFFHSLVARLNDQMRGFEAVVSELWYVEEYDILALALDGKMKVRRFQLGCKRS